MTIARSVLQPGISLAVVSALAFTPLLAEAPTTTFSPSVPHIAAPDITLSAAVSPADIDKLIANLNRQLDGASSTVAGLVGAPGKTLVDALASAVDLNNSLWKQLTAATDNTYLRQVLAALKASSSSGLAGLADTVKSSNSTVTLTTGQLADLLSSVLTGSVSTALHAVANLLNDPLALSSYTGLVGVPLRVAGLAATGVVTGIRDLGVNALSLTSTLVTGVSAQINNALSGFNGIVNATKKAVDVDLINGALTAVQGIVAAPVTAVLAAVDGGVPALTGALGSAVSRIADGAADVVDTWLGDSTAPGAVERAINVVGAAPLSPASYTTALGILVGAGVATGATVAHTVSSLASIPFTAAAKLTVAGGNVIAALASATAKVASGLLQMAGLPSIVHNLPYTVANAVNVAVKTAAAVTAAALNTIGTALNAASSVTGTLTRTNTRMVTLSAADTTTSVTADTASSTAKPDTADESGTPAAEAPRKAAEQQDIRDETTSQVDPQPADSGAQSVTTGPATNATEASEGQTADKASEAATAQDDSATSTPAKDAGTQTPKTGAEPKTGTEPRTGPAASAKPEKDADTTKPAGGATAKTPKRSAPDGAAGSASDDNASSRRGGGTSAAGAGAAGGGSDRGTTHRQRTTATSPKHAAGASEAGESVHSIKARVAAGAAAGGQA